MFQGSNSTLFQLSGTALLSGLTLEGGEDRPVGLESMPGSNVVLANLTFVDLSIGVGLAWTFGSLSLQSCSPLCLTTRLPSLEGQYCSAGRVSLTNSTLSDNQSPEGSA